MTDKPSQGNCISRDLFFPLVVNTAHTHKSTNLMFCVLVPQGSPVSVQVYERYPEGLGAALYREHFDFNAEPPWDPS